MNRWLTGIEFICLIGCFDPSSDSFYGNLGCLFLSMAVSAVIAWKKAKKLHLHGCYNAGKDCVFYDIDCGCAFRDRDPDAKLACIRLEDEKIFYISGCSFVE